MAGRPRRSAAARANESISVQAKWTDASDKTERNVTTSRRPGRPPGPSALRAAAFSPSDSHISVEVRPPRQPLRGAPRRNDSFGGGEIVTGTRNRGGRKNYVIESSPDEDDEDEDDEEEAEMDDVDDDDDDDDMGDVEDERLGEESEADAEGEDVEPIGGLSGTAASVSIKATAPTIRVSQPTIPRSAARVAALKISAEEEEEEDEEEEEEEEEDDDDEEEEEEEDEEEGVEDDGDGDGDNDDEEEEEEEDDKEDDDDDELSDPGESESGDQTIRIGDQAIRFGDRITARIEQDEDAEGEEIEVAGEGDEEMEDVGERAEAAEINSDDEGSDSGSPDLTKMTKRQRARFEEAPQEYMKLSDEVQVKKHFTAEELSMRRQEMARRRRNLSEKRNEEVKAEDSRIAQMETINKLLKKQAPKTNRKGVVATGRAGSPEDDVPKANPVFIRWISNKHGSVVAVPQGMLEAPVGKVFVKSSGMAPGKMVEEVS